MHFSFFRHKPVVDAHAVDPPVDFKVILTDIAQQASGFGKESAELHGLISDLSVVSNKQADTFDTLGREIDAMIKANRTIGNVTSASKASVQRARRTVEQYGVDVSNLTISLKQVANVAEDITRIAVHTRIVSFNALIEAKRAGVSGDGFSVVAEAVRELASRVENSSNLITTSVQQLDARIKQLTQDIMSQETTTNAHHSKKQSFHTVLAKVEQSVDNIATAAQKNLDGCDGLMQSMQGLTQQVKSNTHALQRADKETDGFLTLSEDLIELVAESGVETIDSPFIEAALNLSSLIGLTFEEAIKRGQISADDIFDQDYQSLAGTTPTQLITRYTNFTDQVLPPLLESAIGWSSKIVFCVATDLQGYVPNNVLKFSKPLSSDPIWNTANCRYRRIFDGRTEMAAIRSTRKFLLQTYRRDMGGGHFFVMKHLSAPIFVFDKKWGALRIGYEF